MSNQLRTYRSAALRTLTGGALLAGGLMLEFAGQATLSNAGGSTDGANAVAQGYGAPRRGSGKTRVPKPRVSPYLNLLRNNNTATDPGIEYYTQVRPQFQQQRFNAQQQTALRQLEAETNSFGRTADMPLPVTGRGATYRNYMHFYPSLQTTTRAIAP